SFSSFAQTFFKYALVFVCNFRIPIGGESGEVGTANSSAGSNKTCSRIISASNAWVSGTTCLNTSSDDDDPSNGTRIRLYIAHLHSVRIDRLILCFSGHCCFKRYCLTWWVLWKSSQIIPINRHPQMRTQ